MQDFLCTLWEVLKILGDEVIKTLINSRSPALVTETPTKSNLKRQNPVGLTLLTNLFAVVHDKIYPEIPAKYCFAKFTTA